MPLSGAAPGEEEPPEERAPEEDMPEEALLEAGPPELSSGLTSGFKEMRYGWGEKVADLINDDKLCFLDIFESKSGCTLCFCGVENLNQVGHLLKTYSIATVDSL